MRKFLTFASAFTAGTVNSVEMELYSEKIFRKLEDVFYNAYNAWTAHPTDENKKKLMDDAAGELVCYATLLDVGDMLTDSAIQTMYENALLDPTTENNKMIISLYHEAFGTGLNKKPPPSDLN